MVKVRNSIALGKWSEQNKKKLNRICNGMVKAIEWLLNEYGWSEADQQRKNIIFNHTSKCI